MPVTPSRKTPQWSAAVRKSARQAGTVREAEFLFPSISGSLMNFCLESLHRRETRRNAWRSASDKERKPPWDSGCRTLSWVLLMELKDLGNKGRIRPPEFSKLPE